MPLFQKSVVNKYLKNLNQQTVEDAYKKFQQFYDDAERIENIRLLKEENYQEGFLREVFVDVLGYTINPDKNYNLTTEYKNETDSKKADGAILLDGKAIGVIELKSTKTPDLESIRDQAFNYKNNQSNCRYVISSNFEKLRFYIDNATDWEEFNLFHLDFDSFCKLYLFLSKDSIFNGITAKLKDESKLHEEDITGKLYKDYSVFKQELFADLIKNNPSTDKLLLFHKSQKLLDRILFVLFAEDRGLLPPNAITKIIEQWEKLKELDEEKSLYSRFIKLFHHLDEGHKYKEYELPAYNGGLFKKDDILDKLIISDSALHQKSLKLSAYDFNTEVDVNVLGHIFENSITEIEQVKAEIQGEQSDKNRSRRKKEGIFYTPKYITKYIVDNTVGALCYEKKKELGIDVIENEIIENSRTTKGKLTKKAENLLSKLNDYREYLKSLKILDPACGSGAFLNQALEFLINEHELIDSYRRELEQDSLGLYDITKSILENNLYGVDINEEAVEIAKLSLWIRTAERGRKLSDLNSNIKCGNSLIDDPAVAGDKAFNWNKEFPEIMNKGGFDVVIGNPPYIGEKNNATLFAQLKSMNKWSGFYRRRSNSYYFFIKLGIDLLRKNGHIAFIVPREFITADWANKLRKYIINNSFLHSIIDFSGISIFNDAGTSSCIIHSIKSLGSSFNYLFPNDFERSSNQPVISSFNLINIEIKKLDAMNGLPWLLNSSYENNAVDTDIKIDTLFEITQGVVTGADSVTQKHIASGLVQKDFIGRGIFILKEGIDILTNSDNYKLLINNKWITLSQDDKKLLKPFVYSQQLAKWYIQDSKSYIINFSEYGPTETIVDYLSQFKLILINRSTIVDEIISVQEFESLTRQGVREKYSSAGAVQKIMSKKLWYYPLYERASYNFSGPKILVNSKTMMPFTYSENTLYSSGGGLGGQNFLFPKETICNSLFGTLDHKFSKSDATKIINTILNSSTIKDFLNKSGFNQLSTSKIAEIRLPRQTNNSLELLSLAKALLIIYDDKFSVLKTFYNRINANFNIKDHSQILLEFYNYDFKTFLSELKKKKITLSLKQQDEWEQYFTEYKTEINKLQQQITQTDREIDKLVYKLYGLTEEEIKIVEGV